MPKDHQWLAYASLGREHGSDIVHFDVLGSHVVIVNTAKTAHELFDKRSAIYADRPFFASLRILLGYDWIIGFTEYGEWLRTMRKHFHTFFQPAAVTEYRPLQTKAVHQLLRHLIRKPKDFSWHLRHMTGTIIIRIAYGLKVQPINDPNVEIAEKGLHAVSTASSPGAAIFDLFPMMLHAPSWFPGAGYKKDAKMMRHYSDDMLEVAYRTAKEAIGNGTASPSVTASMISQLNEKLLPEGETIVKQLTGNMYLGKTSPSLQQFLLVFDRKAVTVCALEIFFLAMLLYPDSQRKAQAEIDAIVGTDRLPSFEDQDSLPYVHALMKETLRWHNVTPLGITSIYTGSITPMDII
ncbi:cytochrome P450 [Stereum hirsutum FP-91666 SS1]|uniref:cytochrome P450 n=1 Tax=Stereum hirsutum (strain FP-91666) TaxID=721885 RepID=UPI000444A6C7|nr:cytochrome P450 [Stereum hirsutum FP-91666 SS1]EIM84308.1 cytochrome P450 [Stereum hirsutum FP-91666 SS1]